MNTMPVTELIDKVVDICKKIKLSGWSCLALLLIDIILFVKVCKIWKRVDMQILRQTLYWKEPY